MRISSGQMSASVEVLTSYGIPVEAIRALQNQFCINTIGELVNSKQDELATDPNFTGERWDLLRAAVDRFVRDR